MTEKKNEKKYEMPIVEVINTDVDIITYSETEEWEGPVIAAGLDDLDEK